MREGRQRTEHGGIGDQNIEPLESLEESRAEGVDLVAISQVHGHERRGSPERADLVVGLFEASPGPREEDQVGAFPGIGASDTAANAARRTGDERDTAGQTLIGHGSNRLLGLTHDVGHRDQSASDRRGSWR